MEEEELVEDEEEELVESPYDTEPYEASRASGQVDYEVVVASHDRQNERQPGLPFLARADSQVIKRASKRHARSIRDARLRCNE